jgi:small subunit ribosomal protein S18
LVRENVGPGPVNPGGPGGPGPMGGPPGPGGPPRGRPVGGRPRGRFTPRRKVCQFCVEKVDHIDYKDAPRLRRYISERGKIEPRRKTGTCAKHQRRLAVALKRARHIALLPFTAEHARETGVFIPPPIPGRGPFGRPERVQEPVPPPAQEPSAETEAGELSSVAEPVEASANVIEAPVAPVAEPEVESTSPAAENAAPSAEAESAPAVEAEPAPEVVSTTEQPEVEDGGEGPASASSDQDEVLDDERREAGTTSER